MENEVKPEVTETSPTVETNIDPFGNVVTKETTGTPKEEKKKGLDPKIIGIIAGVIAVIAVLVLVLNGGSSARGIAEKYANAYRKLDAQAIIDILPDELIEKAKEQDVDLKESLDEEFKELDDIKIESVTVKSDEKKLTEEEIKDASLYLESAGIKIDDVSEAVIFEMEMKYTMDDDSKTDSTKFTVIKINGKWKLLPYDIS